MWRCWQRLATLDHPSLEWVRGRKVATAEKDGELGLARNHGARWSEYPSELVVDTLDVLTGIRRAGTTEISRLQRYVGESGRQLGSTHGHHGRVPGCRGSFQSQRRGKAGGKGALGPLEGGDQGFGGLPAYALDFHELRGRHGPLDWHEAEMVVDGLGLAWADVGERLEKEEGVGVRTYLPPLVFELLRSMSVSIRIV